MKERFWSRVCKIKGCWLWTGALDRGGYGNIHVNGKTRRAHRISWELHRGQIPAGAMVCHHCDVRRCVRPDHLFLGSAKDNAADMCSKNRHARQAARGEANGRARLTSAAVREIRRRRQAGETLAVIAAAFGVSITTVQRAATRRLWKHV